MTHEGVVRGSNEHPRSSSAETRNAAPQTPRMPLCGGSAWETVGTLYRTADDFSPLASPTVHRGRAVGRAAQMRCNRCNRNT